MIHEFSFNGIRCPRGNVHRTENLTGALQFNLLLTKAGLEGRSIDHFGLALHLLLTLLTPTAARALFLMTGSFLMFIIPQTTSMKTTEWSKRPVDGQQVGVAIRGPRMERIRRNVSGFAMTKMLNQKWWTWWLSSCFFPSQPHPQSLKIPMLFIIPWKKNVVKSCMNINVPSENSESETLLKVVGGVVFLLILIVIYMITRQYAKMQEIIRRMEIQMKWPLEPRDVMGTISLEPVITSSNISTNGRWDQNLTTQYVPGTVVVLGIIGVVGVRERRVLGV